MGYHLDGDTVEQLSGSRSDGLAAGHLGLYAVAVGASQREPQALYDPLLRKRRRH